MITAGNLSARRNLRCPRCVVQAYRLLAEGAARERLQRQLRPGGLHGGGPEAYAEDEHGVHKDANAIHHFCGRRRMFRCCGDPSKLKAETGWNPLYQIKDTLESLLNHWRKQD